MLIPKNLLAETQLHQWYLKAANAGQGGWAQHFFRLLDRLHHYGDKPTRCLLYAIDDTPSNGYAKEFSFVLSDQQFDKWGERLEPTDPLHRDDPTFIMAGVLYNHGDADNPEWGIHT